MKKTYEDYIKPTEQCWEQYYNEKGELCYLVITKNMLRNPYYLIEINENKRQAIAKASSPIALRKYMDKKKIGEII